MKKSKVICIHCDYAKEIDWIKKKVVVCDKCGSTSWKSGKKKLPSKHDVIEKMRQEDIWDKEFVDKQFE